MYDLGEGVPKNISEAVRLYRLAAEQGHAKAQYNLGVTYNTGEGVPKNLVRAHLWANVAAANGHEEARSFRDWLEQKMDKVQISDAERKAHTCMTSGYTDCD